MRAYIGAAVLAVAACQRGAAEEPPGPICTLDRRPGIVFTAQDSATGAALGGVMLAVARDGGFADTVRSVEATPAGATLGLAFERAGTYTVRVERAGYRPWERAGVVVTGTQCHVLTVVLTALLRPQP